MPSYAFNDLTHLNIFIRPGNHDTIQVINEVKDEFYKNNFFENTNHTSDIIHYNQIESDNNRFVAELDSVAQNNDQIHPNKNLDTPISITFQESTAPLPNCEIEYYKNTLIALTVYDFRHEDADISLENIFVKNDEFINEYSSFELYQTIILINPSRITEENKKNQITRDGLGRINYVFVTDLTASSYVIYDSVRYLSELLQIYLKRLKGGTTPDIRTTFDTKHNFSNVALRIFTGSKWIHSHGRNKKRMADIKLLLGKNLDALELFQQALSSSRHSGDRLFKAVSNFGAAITLYKISLLPNSLWTTNSKFSYIISYFKHHSSKSNRHAHHSGVLEAQQSPEDSSESDNEDIDETDYNDSTKLNPYIRGCLFSCLNTLMRLKTFPFNIFCHMAKSACWFFTSTGMSYELYRVISLLSTFSSLEVRNEWLGDVVRFLSEIGASNRKLAFYTLEIASNPSLNARVALEACKLIGRQLGFDDDWIGRYGWHEVKLALMDVAYNAATSVGEWDEANSLLWSMLLIPTSSSTIDRILHRLNTISLLSTKPCNYKSLSADIIQLRGIKPILNSQHASAHSTSARIRPLFDAESNKPDRSGLYKIRQCTKLRHNRKAVKRTSVQILRQKEVKKEEEPGFRIYTTGPKKGNSIEHQVALGNNGYWEVGSDELLSLTLFNTLPSEIALHGLDIIAGNLEYSSTPTNHNLTPGVNRAILSVKPLISGAISISGIKFSIASRLFALQLSKKISVTVKPKFDMQTHIELLSPSNTEIEHKMFEGRSIPMLFNKSKRVSLCKCTQDAPCTRLCYNVINNSSQRPIDTSDELLYEGEIRYGLARFYNLSQHIITNVKVSFGVNDWRCSHLLFSPLDLKTSKCRLSRDLFLTPHLGASPISTGRLNDTSRSGVTQSSSSRLATNRLNDTSRTIFSSDEFKYSTSIEKGLVIESPFPSTARSGRAQLITLNPDSHLIIPFTLNASEWASQLSINFHWEVDGREAGPVDSCIANPVAKLLEIPQNGINIYPYIELETQLALTAGLRSVHAFSLASNWKHTFDNPRVVLHIKLKNVIEMPLYCIAYNKNIEQIVKIAPGEISSISITTDRVPKTKKHAFEHLDKNINLKWKAGDRTGYLRLSRLAKLGNIRVKQHDKEEGEIRRTKQRAMKNTAHMAIWKRGVYHKSWLDDRTIVSLSNDYDLYERSVYLEVSHNETVITGVMFEIDISIYNAGLEAIKNCWVVLYPYSPPIRMDGALLCSGAMEVKVPEIGLACQSSEPNKISFSFLAVKAGEYRLAAAMIREDTNVILWHYRPIAIKVEGLDICNINTNSDLEDITKSIKICTHRGKGS